MASIRRRRRMVITLPPHYCSSCHRFISAGDGVSGTVSITAERRGKVKGFIPVSHAMAADSQQPMADRTRITAGVLPRDFRIDREGAPDSEEPIEWPVVLAEYDTRVCSHQFLTNHNVETIDPTVLATDEDQVRNRALDQISEWQGWRHHWVTTAPRTSLHSTDFTLAASWRPYLVVVRPRLPGWPSTRGLVQAKRLFVGSNSFP